MKKVIINIEQEIKLIGLTARTNNHDEMRPETAKIGTIIGLYFGDELSKQIPNRKNPGVTLAAYANYESDEHGNYDYFIGEEVSSFNNVPSGMATLIIPAQSYIKFTTDAGQMPELVIHAWQTIWKMSSQDLGGNRTYRADFEVYDQRADDPSNTILDIYLGINPF